MTRPHITSSSDGREQVKRRNMADGATQTDHCNVSNTNVMEKAEVPVDVKKPADLNPIYVSTLLILVGFNFSAFVTNYESEIRGIPSYCKNEY